MAAHGRQVLRIGGALREIAQKEGRLGCEGLQRSNALRLFVQGSVGSNPLINHALRRSELKSPHARQPLAPCAPAVEVTARRHPIPDLVQVPFSGPFRSPQSTVRRPLPLLDSPHSLIRFPGLPLGHIERLRLSCGCPSLRNGIFIQAVFSSSYVCMFSVRPLGSTGVTPLLRYYRPLRHCWLCASQEGFPGSSADLSTRAAPNHPGTPGGCLPVASPPASGFILVGGLAKFLQLLLCSGAPNPG